MRFQPIIVDVRWHRIGGQAGGIEVGLGGIVLAHGVAQQQEGIVVLAGVNTAIVGVCKR